VSWECWHCTPGLAACDLRTDGILSHCKTCLDIAVVYLAVYHALPVISRNSSIRCGGLQPSELLVLPSRLELIRLAAQAACEVKGHRLAIASVEPTTRKVARPVNTSASVLTQRAS